MEYYYKTIFFSQTEGPVYVIIDHLYLLKYHKYFFTFCVLSGFTACRPCEK